jgi:hypothetical protein
MSDLPPPPGSSDPAGSSQPAFSLPTDAPAAAPPTPPRADAPGTSKGPVRLEPLGAGQTIDGAIRLYRSRWKTLMTIAAVILVPFTLVQQFAIHITTHPVLIGGRIYREQPNVAVAVLFAFGMFLVIQPLMQASLIRAVAGIYLGEEVSARDSIRFAASKLGWVVLEVFLASLLTGFGAIALLIGAVFLYVRFYFVVPAVIVEDQKGASITRSWRLTKGRWWHIFGTALLAVILATIATAIFSIPSIMISAGGTGGSFSWIVEAVFSSVASVIVAPFSLGVTVLLYFDARIRKEGFDLAVMAREVGAATP